MAELKCRTCGSSYPLGAYPRGCPACADKKQPGLLEVTYPYGGEARCALQQAFDAPRRRSLWRFGALLPLAPDAEPVTLGEGSTPLLEASWLGEFTAAETVFLKNETTNPTWSFKDRGNTVTVSVGRGIGVGGLVATTTGNHGASLAAYCARASLPAIILCSIHSDVIHRAMVSAYGATAIVSADCDAILKHLVHECGWFPVTSLGTGDAPNPFGAEGNKTIAYEIFEDLQGIPDAVLIPVSSGDLLYGVFKGFRELMELGFASRCPRIIGCQAEGAAPLAAAMRHQLSEVPVLPRANTVATSICDVSGGQPSLEAIRTSQGDVVTVSDEEILQAQRILAAGGFLVEPASAASVAALAAGVRTGVVSRREQVVCLLTGAGVKWSTQLLSVVAERVLLEPKLATVTALVSKVAPEVG